MKPAEMKYTVEESAFKRVLGDSGGMGQQTGAPAGDFTKAGRLS